MRLREEQGLSLTAPERETVITFSDDGDTATIHTHQRKIITRLKNNSAATLVEDLTFEGSAGAVFKVPSDLISFRSGRRKLSPAQAQAAAANLEGCGQPPRPRQTAAIRPKHYSDNPAASRASSRSLYSWTEAIRPVRIRQTFHSRISTSAELPFPRPR
jgi:hypothetical protein